MPHCHAHPHLPIQVVAEAQAADATGNYRDIAWRLVAAAAAAASDTPLPVLGVRGKEAAAAAAVKRSYSTGDGGHSFNTLMAPAPTPVSVSGSGSPPQASWLLFLCLADAESGTQEAFRFLEVRILGLGIVGMTCSSFSMCVLVSCECPSTIILLIVRPPHNAQPMSTDTHRR